MTINQNILFSSENYLDQAIVTGGTTLQGFPVSKVSTINLYDFCKFSGVLATNSYFILEFTGFKSLQLFALLKTNVSNAATWRVRVADTLANVTAAPTYDSGSVPCVPPYGAFGELPWGEFDWGDVLPPTFGQYLNKNSFLPLVEPVFGKFVRIDIDDQLENTQGNISVARLWLGAIYQPSLNVNYGASVQLKDTTTTRKSESGVRKYGTRYQRRIVNGTFDLPQTELFYNIFGKLHTVKGVNGELVCILDPLTPSSYIQSAVYGNMEENDPVKFDNWAHSTTNFTIDERV